LSAAPSPAVLLFGLLALLPQVRAQDELIFIGTYTDGASRGIYSTRLDSATGALSAPILAVATPNPAFLALHPNGRVLYSLDTLGLSGGHPGGAAGAFAIDRSAGTLQKLNSESAGTVAITHLAADATGKMLAVASFGGGAVASFPIRTDGSLGARASFYLSQGPLGPNRDRQDQPHAHSVTFSPDNRHVYSCDLGRDRILCFAVDPEAATLTLAAEYPTEPGAGPRHSKFSSDGRCFYEVNEVNNTVGVYRCDPASGALTALQVLPTLPPDFHGANTAAEIRIHPNGRFVYASNRGHNSIAVFARNRADGRLTLVEIVPSGGIQPRNFALASSGAWLVCANRESNNLVVFRVDPETGRLKRSGQTAVVPAPVCVLFAPES